MSLSRLSSTFILTLTATFLWYNDRAVMTSFDIYTVKESDSIQPLSPQSHFSAVDCFYRDFFAEPPKIALLPVLFMFHKTHCTYACKYCINADNSVLCIDETCKMRYNKYIKFYWPNSFDFLWKGRIGYDRYAQHIMAL